MNKQTDGAAAALQTTGKDPVQTSAQAAAEVVHKEPALGGSYVRNPDTGDLVKQAPQTEEGEGE
ncbi:hypothetical protein [Massilia varians]|uniref:hypothetical protein n=1 Tax=Massilia varians TaxID=457921 RepID=UPI00255241CA|nr:hypothetical protein [Massilia varians]MDK6079661.1 hypothetical protein [Massilia varians]